jgi:hypothetical protein
MSASTRAGRLFALAVGLIAAMSLLFAGSALAAGKPKSVSIESVKPTVNSTTLLGKANPNGAATTLYFEQWIPAKAAWSLLATKAIGSGTTVVSAEQSVKGLSTQTETYFRVKAENSFGPSLSNELSFYSYWSVGGEPLEASISQYGTFRMEFYHGSQFKVECSESGNGKINAGSNNSQTVNVSNCTTYERGIVRCHPNPTKFTFNEHEAAPTSNWDVYCESQVEWNLKFSEPFNFIALGAGLTAPVNMTTTASGYGGSPIITIESKWSLEAPYNNKTLGWVLE